MNYDALDSMPKLDPLRFDKVNVHGYYEGTGRFHDNSARQKLHQLTKDMGKSLWMTEYGDNDGTGLTLAKQILEDINFLRPTAWFYWQAVEAHDWVGFANAHTAEYPVHIEAIAADHLLSLFAINRVINLGGHSTFSMEHRQGRVEGAP